MTRPTWEGVYPALTTNFHQDESLDLEGFKSNAIAQLQAGVHGLIVCGSLGENALLETSEKMELLRAAKEISKVPVIMTVAEVSTRKAKEFAKLSKAEGADGLMVLPPMRYPSDMRETLAYMHAVADAGGLPALIYNNPVAYKTFIDLESFADLAQNPHYEATKESTGDIRYMTDLINRFGDRFKIMAGVDDLALESLMMGAHGWIAGMVDAFPRETVVLYELIKQKRYDEALPIYRWFFPMLHLDVSTKFVQNIKLAEQMVGLGSEWVREPRLILAGDERENVIKIIQNSIDTKPVLPVV